MSRKASTLLLAFMFLASFLSNQRAFASTQIVRFTPDEIVLIFTSSDIDSNNTLDHEELRKGLTDSLIKVFKKASFYVDEDMIKALADEIVQEQPQSTDMEAFSTLMENLFERAKNFRRKIFDELIEAYDLKSLLNGDDMITREIEKTPQNFGLTYKAWKMMFHDLKKMTYYSAGDTLGALDELQKMFEQTKANIPEGLNIDDILNDSFMKEELKKLKIDDETFKKTYESLKDELTKKGQNKSEL